MDDPLAVDEVRLIDPEATLTLLLDEVPGGAEGEAWAAIVKATVPR